MVNKLSKSLGRKDNQSHKISVRTTRALTEAHVSRHGRQPL